MSNEPIPVLFRMWRGEVIAIFPTLPGDQNPATCESFMHVGQHGTCTPHSIVAGSRPAQQLEYVALLHELTSEPYRYRLHVVHRLQQRYAEIRRNSGGLKDIQESA